MPIASRPISAACCCPRPPTMAMIATKTRHAARIFICTDIRTSRPRNDATECESFHRHGHFHAGMDTAADLEAPGLVKFVAQILTGFLQPEVGSFVVVIDH